MVAFEAAVAGGIPIIKALREGLTANRIQWIAGIINGTTNFILSEMRDKGLDFDVVLKEAQRLGYAEADPTFDIEGVDAAHKAPSCRPSPSASRCSSTRPCRGHHQARGRGHQVRRAAGLPHQAAGHHQAPRAEGVELRVHPTLIPAKRLIANVEGAMNAVLVQGDAVGTTLYYGKGAGAEPTASAVIADLVDITRLHTADPEHRVPHLAFQPDQCRTRRSCRWRGGIRLLPAPARRGQARRAGRHHPHPGRPADLDRRDAAARAGRGRGRQQTDIIMLTHDTREKNVDAAIAASRRCRWCTRGEARPQSFCDILLGGLAPDGGLYLPGIYPQVDAPTLPSGAACPTMRWPFEILSLSSTTSRPAT
jgi:homoserine dehydrogenase